MFQNESPMRTHLSGAEKSSGWLIKEEKEKFTKSLYFSSRPRALSYHSTSSPRLIPAKTESLLRTSSRNLQKSEYCLLKFTPARLRPTLTHGSLSSNMARQRHESLHKNKLRQNDGLRKHTDKIT